MTRSYKISESAIDLRPGHRLFETDGGGLWYHTGTVTGVSEEVEVVDGRYRSKDVVALDLELPSRRNSTIRAPSFKNFVVEVIA